MHPVQVFARFYPYSYTLKLGAQNPIEQACFTDVAYFDIDSRRRSKYFTILLSHAGQLSYVPTKEAFAGEGYEVKLARRRGLAEDAQQRVLDSVRERLFG